MPVPSYRVPVRIARGTYANLSTNLGSLEEGEIVYANDENALYVVEGGILTKSSADLGISSVGDLGDVDTSTTAPTDGQVLTWDNAASQWEPANVAASLADLTDTSITIPATGEVLRYNGSAWVDAQLDYSDLSGTPTLGTAAAANIADFATAAQGATADSAVQPTDSISTLADVTVTAPSNGQALVWNGSAWVNSTVSTVGSIDDLTDVDTSTTAPTDGQVLTYVAANSQWEPTTPAPGGVTSIIAGSGISVDQATGDVTVSATGSAGVANNSLIAPFGHGYVAATAAGTGTGLTWGAWNAGTGNIAVTFDAAQPDANYSVITDNESADDVYVAVANKTTAGFTLTTYDVNGNPTSPSTYPFTFQVYGSDPTIEITGGFYGIGVATRTSDSGTAASSELTLTNLGSSGQLHTLSTDLDAWVVFYGSAADRTADAGRAYNTDPAAGSGVLAEAYVTTASAILFTPGTMYMNNDTTETSALYLAVRNQAGAAVNATLTVSAYVQGGFNGVSGGTFGSG